MTRARLRTIGLLGVIAIGACQPAGDSSSPPGATESAAIESSEPSTPATPKATTAGEHPALVIDLGTDAAPIDVIAGFGSVWVANHHADTVTRVNPATGLEEATVHLAAFTTFPGPAWFAVADDAVWVTRQNDAGMARIDPESSEPDPLQLGTRPPCGPPAVGLGAAWYFACDSGNMERIDLATHEVTRVPAADLSPPIIVDNVLYAVGPDGVVRLSDEGTWIVVGGCCGFPIGYAGGTLWLADRSAVLRVDLATGSVVATIPLPSIGTMSAGPEIAWLAPAEGFPGPLQQVRLADNTILDELPVSSTPTVVRVDGETLWVTDFNASELWRIDLGD